MIFGAEHLSPLKRIQVFCLRFLHFIKSGIRWKNMCPDWLNPVNFWTRRIYFLKDLLNSYLILLLMTLFKHWRHVVGKVGKKTWNSWSINEVVELAIWVALIEKQQYLKKEERERKGMKTELFVWTRGKKTAVNQLWAPTLLIRYSVI